MLPPPNSHTTTTALFSGLIAAFATISIFTAHPAISGDAASAPQEIGVWYDDTKRGAVEITQCGEHLCGHIFWLLEPLTKDGEPIYDKYNSDEALNKRPVCGIQVLGKLARQTDGTFDNGWVYDPKVGHTFSAAINLENPDQLHVRGYASLKILGKSLYWTRAPADLARCTIEASTP